MFQVLTSRKLLIVALVVLVLLGSYFYFSNYRPKSIRELKEVKAAQDSNVFEFAYPFEAAEVGTTENELGSQTTFVTNKDPISVHKFYRNVFDSKGWENYPMYKIRNSTFLLTRKIWSKSKLLHIIVRNKTKLLLLLSILEL